MSYDSEEIGEHALVCHHGLASTRTLIGISVYDILMAFCFSGLAVFRDFLCSTKC
jgi:hypothetical protein